ncbi:MAG: tetratricopeptide repeat protein, partial [Phycisphaerae bacterium]|nr:tetratricopeptide repeat protein [Phycisphaerae bacterium]
MTALAYLYAGNPDKGLKIIEEGLKMPINQSKSYILHYIKSILLYAKGRYEEALDLQLLNPNESEKIFEEARYAAVKGDSISVHKILEKATVNNWTQSDIIRLNAIIGNRKKANQLAAELDSKPYGPMVLITISRYCLCGAPFDIDVTPNFKKRVEEAGVPWPPASHIQYPLKKW